MEKTLLGRARTDIGLAKLSLEQGDEYYLDAAEFHLQQAVEKVLKNFIALHGSNPRKTHDIYQLYSDACDRGLVIPANLERDLLLVAKTLNDAEAESRYASAYLTTRDSVVKNYKFVIALCQFIYPEINASTTDSGVKCMKLE